MLGYPKKIFQKLIMPGTSIGHLTDKIKEEVGFDLEVVAPATHDTGSAVLAVPTNDDDFIYISSGTWSLMGIERKEADCSEKSCEMNFTNEGGYLTQFYPYTGPVTYLAITQDADGHFRFVVAEGVNEEGKILSFGDTNMRTRFTCGAREFVNRWSEAGPTHHMAAATGRHIDTILKVAKIFNVPVDIVTR